MSLTLLEPTTQELEARAAAERMRDELHQHLTEMTDLCEQIRTARDVEADDDSRGLYDELLETIESHHGQITEQLAELEHADLFETATYTR